MIDNREYGLVLAGGGTKGAYQVGVWKALKELNINVKGIVGASIGSLNGALFLQDDFKMVEDNLYNATFPQQKLPLSKKDDQWQHDCVNYIIGEGNIVSGGMTKTRFGEL